VVSVIETECVYCEADEFLLAVIQRT